MDYGKTLNLPETEFPMRGNLPQKEPGILERWEKEDIYKKTLENREGAPTFILHDGPPYANGDIHLGHALNKVLKETEDPLIKGIIYNVVNQTDKAKEYFEEAKSEGNMDAVFYLANIYEKAGDHNYAMILLEEYIASDKASAEGFLSVGRHYFNNEDYESALKTLQAGIALGESGVLKNLMQEEIACLEKLGDFAGAREKAAEYLEKYPDDAMMQKEYEFLKSR